MRRLEQGGGPDRTRELGFWFDGIPYTGYAGDTLASALLGAGVSVLGRSVTLGRPRGIMAARMEEPTGFVQLSTPGATEPLVRASSVLLYDGLLAESRLTRGYVEERDDRAVFTRRSAHCDVCVVGTGPAGLAAAQVVTAAGVRVVVVEADPSPGGALLRDNLTIADRHGAVWAAETVAALRQQPDVQVLTDATAMTSIDGGGLIVVQRIGSQVAPRDRWGTPEMCLWQVRARCVVLATGMLERPLVFQDNDRPGIMLASAAREYLERFALAPHQAGVVFTTTDDGYRTALAWQAAGIPVAAIVDPRTTVGALRQQAERDGARCIHGVVEGTTADAAGHLSGVKVRSARGVEVISTDLLAVSGGYEPASALHTERKGSTTYDPWWATHVPDKALGTQWIAGGVRGRVTLADCLADGARAGREALKGLGVSAPASEPPLCARENETEPAQLWHVPAPDGDESRSFVDLHRDVSVAGVTRAIGAGITHIEHLKRYTLIGTGIDQGRSARTNSGVLAAALTDRPVAGVGTSGSRPPVEPMVFGVLAGGASGPMFSPVRTTPIHTSHEALGAVFEPVGLWLRPSRYPRPGETVAGTVGRECRVVRYSVGIMDASTLGKIDVQGPDATWFLEQLYINSIGTLPVGKGRYGAMCRMDGTLLDDGTVLRLGEHHYIVTTSTGHAAAVMEWMEEWRQTEWPGRRVWITNVTEQLATVVIAGPRAREVMTVMAPGLELSRSAFPFLGVRCGTVAGMSRAMVARVSFSGELAFEVSVPWDRGQTLWEAAMSAGSPWRISPYGLDALQVLRMEKGYIIVGQDTDATTTPYDAGLGWMIRGNKEFVGKRSLVRPAMQRADRPQLCGFVTEDPEVVLPEGAGLVSRIHEPPMPIVGHVSSSAYSATLGRSLGLAMVRGGRTRIGERLFAPVEQGVVAVTLVDPVHVDPEGTKRDGWEGTER